MHIRELWSWKPPLPAGLPTWIFRWIFAIGMLITLIAAVVEMIDMFRIASGKEVVRSLGRAETLLRAQKEQEKVLSLLSLLREQKKQPKKLSKKI